MAEKFVKGEADVVLEADIRGVLESVTYNFSSTMG